MTDTKTNANTQILIVDDDETAAAGLQECLRGLGYAVCAAVARGRLAIETAAATRPDLALIALGLAGEATGPDVGRRLGSLDIPVVYLTDGAAADGDLLQRAAASDPFGYVLRPFDGAQLRLTIETAVAGHARERGQRASGVGLQQEVDRLQALTASMEAVFATMSEGVIVIGEDLVPLFHNRSAERICDVQAMKRDIRYWAEECVVYRSDMHTRVPMAENPLMLALSGRPTAEVDLFVRNDLNPDGVHVRVSASPVPGACGQWSGAALVLRDITKLKQAEAELEQAVVRHRNEAQLMETIFASISDGVVVADAQGKFTMFNASAERIVGLGKLDLKTEQWSEAYGVFLPDRKTRVSTEQLPLVRAIRGAEVDQIELFIRNEKRPDGVYVSVNGRPLPPNGGAGGGGVIVFRDVTRQKQAAAELEKTMAELRYQSELMETTFRSISDGLVVADAAGNFLYVNPSAEQIVGMGVTKGSQDEWDTTYGTYHPDRETPMATQDLPLIRAIHGGESVDEEDLFVRNQNRPDGVYIRVSARPLLDRIGGIRGGVIIFRDVTERVLAEAALAQAFAHGRLEIVETILHNIGNAITSVTTGIETVRRNLVHDRVGRRLGALAAALGEHRDDWIEYLRSDPQGRKVLPFIIELAAGFAARDGELIKTVDRVRDRANHIADIVRTQKALGTATMDRKDIDLRDALAAVVRVLRDSLAKRQIRTSIDCERAPREIRVRESPFHQMLVNLVKNGIEAIDDLAVAQGLDEPPRIRISACTGERFLVLDVTDNGIGIRTPDTRVLFAPGYTTKESGSGLGLHSAANFVIASGGRIQPLSEGAGKGTTMRVLLPLSAVVPAAASEPDDGG